MNDPTRNKYSRRFFIGGLLAGSAARADAPLTAIRPIARAKDFQKYSVASAQELIAKSGLTGKVGFSIADANTGLVLETHNPLLGMPPASVAKTFTAQYALDVLGPTYRFTTRLMATGPVVDGVLKGDLVLVGGGDPTLDTDGLSELAAALKSTGVRQVEGAFIVDESALPHVDRIDPDQPDHVGYNPSISGINLNFNRVHFEWRRTGKDYQVTMDARSERHRPKVTMARMKISARDVPVYTYVQEGNIDHWTVARSALGKSGSRWLPVRHPASYAAEVFANLARAQGIRLSPATTAAGPFAGNQLVKRKSQPLNVILKGMLKYSTNLTAEAVGLSSSVQYGGKIDGLMGSAQTMERWAKTRLGVRHPKFADHSGLSDTARISAADMVTALVRVGPHGTLSSLLKPIAVRNSAGNILKNSPVSIHAKTGTLNFVSALAGYVKAADGTDLAFAIFAADLERRDDISENDRERPKGSRGWNGRARKLQQSLIDRWATLYGT